MPSRHHDIIKEILPQNKPDNQSILSTTWGLFIQLKLEIGVAIGVGAVLTPPVGETISPDSIVVLSTSVRSNVIGVDIFLTLSTIRTFAEDYASWATCSPYTMFSPVWSSFRIVFGKSVGIEPVGTFRDGPAVIPFDAMATECGVVGGGTWLDGEVPKVLLTGAFSMATS